MESLRWTTSIIVVSSFLLCFGVEAPSSSCSKKAASDVHIGVLGASPSASVDQMPDIVSTTSESLNFGEPIRPATKGTLQMLQVSSHFKAKEVKCRGQHCEHHQTVEEADGQELEQTISSENAKDHGSDKRVKSFREAAFQNVVAGKFGEELSLHFQGSKVSSPVTKADSKITSWLAIEAAKGHKSCDGLQTSWFFVVSALDIFGCLACIVHVIIWRARPVSLPTAPSSDVIARKICLVFIALQNMYFTLVIPDSLGVAKALGGGPTYSGFLVSTYKLTQPLGALCVWSLYKLSPSMWVDSLRSQMIICALFLLVGGILYSIAVSRILLLETHGYWTAIIARAVAGVGGGMAAQFARQVTARTVTTRERPNAYVRLYLAMAIGIGLGPLVGSVLRGSFQAACLQEVPSHPHQFGYDSLHVVGQAKILLSIGLLWTVLRYMPPVEDIRRSSQKTEDSGLDSVEPDCGILMQSFLTCCCLCVSMSRGYVVAGVESASVMIFEQTYGWPLNWTGPVVACTFLVSVPIKYAYEKLRARCSVVVWLRCFMLASITGCALLFRPPWIHSPTGRVCVLLLADSLIFPCFFIASGLVEGFMVKNLPSQSSWLTLNNVTLLQTIVVDGIARFSGPPMSRNTLNNYGQNGYATSQFVITFIAAVLIEMLLCIDKRL